YVLREAFQYAPPGRRSRPASATPQSKGPAKSHAVQCCLRVSPQSHEAAIRQPSHPASAKPPRKQKRGRNENQRLPLILPSLVAAETVRKAFHQQPVGFRRDDQLTCRMLNRKLRRVLLKLPLRLGSRRCNLLLGSRQNLLFFYLNAGLDALFVALRIGFRLLPHAGDLLIQLGQPRFDIVQPRSRFFRCRTRIPEALLNIAAALAEGLRQHLQQAISNSDSKHTEVEPGE